jgi:hypothetical protein
VEFSKLLYKNLKVQLAPTVLDILFAVFGDDQGLLDGPAFVAVMKSRNRVPGYRVREGQEGRGAPGGKDRCYLKLDFLKTILCGQISLPPNPTSSRLNVASRKLA